MKSCFCCNFKGSYLYAVCRTGRYRKEVERLHKEEEKLNKELARVKGMLSNERFVSKAPESKVAEEKAKLEKYTNMMEQVKERLKQLEK